MVKYMEISNLNHMVTAFMWFAIFLEMAEFVGNLTSTTDILLSLLIITITVNYFLIEERKIDWNPFSVWVLARLSPSLRKGFTARRKRKKKSTTLP